MIQTKNLYKTFRDRKKGELHALQDVSLTVSAGRFVLLTGPSGSGKTTLLSLLGAMTRPTRGSITFQGRNLAECSDVELARLRRDVGFVFQNFSLVPRLAVWENITYPLIPRGIPVAARFETARRLLRRLNLEDRIESRPEQLSGGEQQRVAVARALAAEPQLILADEPTSNLDLRAAGELTELFEEIHGSGVTMVISTHSAAMLDLATDVYTLTEGKLSCG